MSRRATILKELNLAELIGVEIGALDKPLVTPDLGQIIYVDHADTEQLRKKYADHADVRPEAIVPVTGVWGSNTLLEAIGSRKVDYVVASHVIEHVPDLISWLKELEDVLAPGGQICLAIPDMRYTFDCLRRETVFSDLLPAYIAHARHPMPREVMDFTHNVVEVKCDVLWHRPPTRAAVRKLYTPQDAIKLGETSMHGEYHDAHCWTFTPASFARLMAEISKAGLTRLVCRSFTDTPFGNMEFYVALSIDGVDKPLSWSEMERAARTNPGNKPFLRFASLLHPRVLLPKIRRIQAKRTR